MAKAAEAERPVADAERRGGPGKGDALDSEEIRASVGSTMPRRKSKVHKGDGLWLMSFSDMSLILMSFFVLQLSFSAPDRRKYENLSAAITKTPSTTAQAAATPAIENLKSIEGKLTKVIKEQHLEAVVEVRYDINGLAIEFKDHTIFAPGSAVPNPVSAKLVEDVMRTIAATPGDYRLIFEGHTDDVPILGPRFRSNWDLAAARSVALLGTFRARGVKEARMSVIAYAQTRPKIATSGLSGEALRRARAANRRVVVRLE